MAALGNGEVALADQPRCALYRPCAICSVPASKTGDERHVIGLVGKLLNASDELSPETIASDTFKAIVTGDPIEGRDVYKSRVEFRSVAQNLFAANQLPSFKGGVDRGLQRLLLLIAFTRSIPMEERIEDIGKRIAAEEPDQLLAAVGDGRAADVSRCRGRPMSPVRLPARARARSPPLRRGSTARGPASAPRPSRPSRPSPCWCA